jgi:hypothetical protein
MPYTLGGSFSGGTVPDATTFESAVTFESSLLLPGSVDANDVLTIAGGDNVADATLTLTVTAANVVSLQTGGGSGIRLNSNGGIYANDNNGFFSWPNGDIVLNRAAANKFGVKATSGVAFSSDTPLMWSSTTAVSGTPDVGLAREAAGVMAITNGSTGAGSLALRGSVDPADVLTIAAGDNTADRTLTLTAGTNLTLALDSGDIVVSTDLELGSSNQYRIGTDTNLLRAAAGVVRVGSSSGLGYLRSGQNVSPNTGTVAAAVTDSGILYSNTGDTDGSTITLPDNPTIGATYEAFANVNQAITINAATGETILDGTTSGTSTVSSTQGAWIRLVAVTGGSGAIWGVCGKLGTWNTT